MITTPRLAIKAAVGIPLCLMLVACEGLSDGNRPESVAVTAVSGGIVYRCLTSAVTAAATFTDGTVSDYSQRMTWSSSDPGVVEVSNGDIEIGTTGSYYAVGTLIAHSEGVATITGDIAGLSDTTQVEVKSVADLYVEGETSVVATGSDAHLTAYVVLDPDDTPVDITSLVDWSLPSADGSLDVGADTGIVTALAPGVAQSVRAGFASCEDGAEFVVQAADATSLRLEREFTNDTELAVGTSERYTVYAGFADPSLAEQNLSDDVDVELQETESERAVLSTTDAHLYLTALDESDGEGIHVRFDPADLEADSPLRVQVEREFDTLTVSPENAELAWDDELQLTAIATESATGVTQDVTRHVSWELDVDDVLTVADTLDDAGLVTPIGDQDGDVQIIATLSAATTETVDTIIQVRVTTE